MEALTSFDKLEFILEDVGSAASFLNAGLFSFGQLLDVTVHGVLRGKSVSRGKFGPLQAKLGARKTYKDDSDFWGHIERLKTSE